MTTRDKGITYPVWSFLRLTNGIFEVSSLADFSSNASYKYTSTGIAPISATAPIAATPQSLNLTAQNSNGGFAAQGASVNTTPGTGTGGNASGNLVVKDTASNGGAYNTSHLVLGPYHLWIDSSSRLRIKGSAPSSDTDGNVVALDISGSTTYDPPNLADGAGVTTPFAVSGAALGDFVIPSFSLDTQGILLYAWVSSANTVSVRFQNESGGALDLASGTLRVKVIKA